MSKFYFDSDCLSAFLVVQKLSIPVMLYKGNVYIPRIVYNEVTDSRNCGYEDQLSRYINKGLIKLIDFEPYDDVGKLYYQLVQNPEDGFKAIGRGEAAAIALAKNNKGILASNNLNDVSQYVKKYSLDHVTTGMIIYQAVQDEVITEEEAETMWDEMVNNWCKLGAKTYKEYVEKKLYDIVY